MSQVSCTIKEDLKAIPFVEIVSPYAERFIEQAHLESFPHLWDKLECRLLEELSYIAEITLQAELDIFVANGNSDFDEFVEITTSSLARDYPVLDEKLRIKVRDFSNHIFNIITRFSKDTVLIESTFNLKNIKILDIDVSLGDGHNGEGTASVSLSDEIKLIYKPRNIGITNSYNYFINWVNDKVKTDLKTFTVLDRGKYGWIEFVHHEAVTSEEDLKEYYYKAGVLLAVTLLLGSKDCHHGNLIASGKNPVIIDHETIIQPFFSDKSFHSWDDQFKIPPFSVLESVLIVDQTTGAPVGNVGYGVKGHIEVLSVEKKVINSNTIFSKRSTHFVTRETVEKNIPVFEGRRIFATSYKKYFIDGFSVAYDVFLHSKDELVSKKSPINIFLSSEVRYVWRPTFIYFKILKYMRLSSFMSNYDVYYSTLRNLLSKAFKEKNREDYTFILDFELNQMLNGDIPIFTLGSNDDFLEGNNSLKVFQYSCLQNIFYRIGLLSYAHKDEQLSYINKWLDL